MPVVQRDILDYANVIAAFASPLLAWLATIWTIRRQAKEDIDFTISWRFEHLFNGGPMEYPFLVLYNRSDQTLLVNDIRFAKGMFFKRLSLAQAILCNGDGEYDFPYIIKGKATWSRPLDVTFASHFYSKMGPIDFFLDRLQFPNTSLVISTASNKKHCLRTSEFLETNYRPGFVWKDKQ